MPNTRLQGSVNSVETGASDSSHAVEPHVSDRQPFETVTGKCHHGRQSLTEIRQCLADWGGYVIAVSLEKSSLQSDTTPVISEGQAAHRLVMHAKSSRPPEQGGPRPSISHTVFHATAVSIL